MPQAAKKDNVIYMSKGGPPIRDREKGSTFYQEFLRTIADVNRQRARQGRDELSYRRCVREGLLYPDSYTGRLKSGDITPTQDRLESAAGLLEVRPEIWTAYVERKIESTYSKHPGVIELFRIIESVPEAVQEDLIGSVLSWVQDGVYEATHQRKKL